MILRTWTARATPEGVDAYRQYFEGVLLGALRRRPGFRGACLVRVEEPAGLSTLTFWESMSAIRAFAGEDVDTAVVEPEAQAVLTEFDRTVTHMEVLTEAGL
jgi:heme-degrading monooxygenase HmoA